jgi:hypothetical protein
MPTTLKSLTIASALVAAPAHADPLEIEAGGAHVTFGTPERETTYAAAISLGIGKTFELRSIGRVDATLRGHVTIGDGVIAALGLQFRHRVGKRMFLGWGPGIASLIGSDDTAMRASGIGLAGDLRAGVRIGDITLAVEALPIWVFASDSVSRTAHLDCALELGLALGYQR